MSNSIDKKFRIFVSSVGRMMEAERKTLRELIWKSGNIPIAMEGFTGNHEQTSIEIVQENLDNADIVIFVLGFTYGSVIGEGLKCKDCSIKNSCDGKKKKVGNCAVSYTHFEYLYAKANNILSYCIIQKDSQNTDCFNRRIKTFLSQSQYGNSDLSKIEDSLRAEFYTKKEIYKAFLAKATKKWAYFYDANSGASIESSITGIFTEIVNRLPVDGSNIYGLIDGNQVKRELIEKNRLIADLEKEVNKLSRDMITALSQAYQVTCWPTTAVTGTCIPFIYDDKENTILTYLVCNSAYLKGSRLMFPGGHAFVNEESPEAIAIIKAKTEAGLDVKPLNLNFDPSIHSSEFSTQFCVYRPPHFTYLFEQDPHVKCYKEKNHLHHYDAVYICEVSFIHPESECSQERVTVKLPTKPLAIVQMKKLLGIAIAEFNKQYRNNLEPETFGDYIAKMLYDAHKSYINYLYNVDREGHKDGTT